jgi:hypothetical protein
MHITIAPSHQIVDVGGMDGAKRDPHATPAGHRGARKTPRLAMM